ncbi:MAG: PAS domain-containing sensor histidine kinase [Acidimicrobiales bacterium]|nr:PAS domain-containing sensor histidine kinase [Acidimicrobiales bacterium]
MESQEVDLSDPLASALFDSSPDGIVIVDESGTIVLANSVAHAMFGYEPGTLVGTLVEELVPTRHRERHEADRDAYHASPHARPMGVGLELSARRADRSEFPVEISLSPLQSAGGLLVVAAVRDVTERLASQAHARRIQQSLDAISDGVFMFGPDDLRFTYVNQGAIEQVGYTRAELVEMGPIDLMVDYDEEALRAILAPLLDHRVGSRSLTTRHRRRDGQWVPVEVVVQCPDLGRGLEPTVVALVRDISERLESEHRLREAHEAVQLLEDRERIARELHDTVIQRLFATGMSAQALAGRVGDPDAADRLRGVVDDLDTTIRDIRTAIFGLQGGAFRSGLRAQVLEVVREATAVLGFEPRVHFVGPIDATVTGEVVEHLLPTLREALANVARHAEAAQVEVTVSGSAERLVLEVADDGVGVRTSAEGARSANSGHGLVNMAQRAEQLGGTCELRPGVQSGTVLVWDVPVAVGAEPD